MPQSLPMLLLILHRQDQHGPVIETDDNFETLIPAIPAISAVG